LCDTNTLVTLKGIFYRMEVRPACCMAKAQVQNMMVSKMKMFWRTCGYIRLDRIKNELTRQNIRAAPIEDEMWKARFRWVTSIGVFTGKQKLNKKNQRVTHACMRRCQEVCNYELCERQRKNK